MRPDGGGGGATILIDPDSLRRAGSRLQGVAGELQRLQAALSSLDVPLLPPSVAGLVPGAISAGTTATGTYGPSLESAVVELTRRAFWAEYADQMMAGYPLTGPALQQFEQYMIDGTLLDYATPAQAAAAGRELAKIGANFRKDPQLLFVLAASLKGGESELDTTVRNAFEGGFVTEFGASRLNEIPRAIQAIESSRQIEFDSGLTDPYVLRDMALLAQQQGIDLHGADPVKDLLAPFSVALADATMAGLVTRTEEEAIAANRDTYSTAALLSQGGEFGKDFLLDCFKTGVVNKIALDSRSYILGNPAGPPMPVEYGLGWSNGHALPNDTKQIVMAALAKNPEAAAAALTQPVDVQVADEYGQWNEVSDPVQLLYQYGHFGDHGTAFASVYTVATNELHGAHASLDELRQGNTITASLAREIADSPRGDMAPLTTALAHDLADHQIAQLHQLSVDSHEDPRGIWVDSDPSTHYAIQMSKPELTALLSHVSDDNAGFKYLLGKAAEYQTQQMVSHLGTGDVAWAYRAGGFEQTVLNATDMSSIDQYNAAEARHQAVAAFVNSLSNFVPVEGAVAHTALDLGMDTVDNLMSGPSVHDLVTQSDAAKASISNGLSAAVVTAYYDHGELAGTHPPHDIVDANGTLKSYADLRGDARVHFENWMNNDDVIRTKLAPVWSQITDAGFHQDTDQQGPG